MAVNVIMPSLGFDMTEGTLTRWLKKEGERVERGQAIAEIETEKATVEIEATASGVLTRIIVQPGQTVPVGTVMAIIAEMGEMTTETAPTGPSPSAPSAAPAADKEKDETLSPSTPHPSPAAEQVADKAAVPPKVRVKASPVARRMAEEAEVDLASIQGTGPDGRVMERDVQAAIAARPLPPQASGAPVTVAPAGESVSVNRMRRAIARRMTESKTTAPHFYVTVEINMDEAIRLREQLNRLASDAEKVSLTDLIVAAAARTLTRFPNLNASYGDGSLEMHSQINIGIATALDDGLITPVLREADRKTLKAIAAESKALSTRARANKLRSDDLGSGTFTVSNLGMFGVDEFTAIINPPEAAILAVGAMTRRPIVVGDEVQIASILRATLSVDHRVADGAQAGRFLQEFRKLLENPLNFVAG